MAIDKNAVIKEAQKFAAKGQFDKAIIEWKKVANESPNDANIFNTIGDLCLKKNSKPEAVEAYKKAADILASDGFTSKALALYKKVLNIDPKKIEAHLALADLNAEKGLTGNALESYKVVADHYTQNKNTQKALGIYQKMADLNTANIAFRLKLAEMYAKEGMKKEAVTAYLQAADVHVSKEAFKDARQLFEKALALDPNNKEVYHKAGLVYFKEGKFVEACKALKPAFESDSSNTELVDLYLDALSKSGRGAEVVEVYQKLLSQDPDRIDLREKLYRVFLLQEDYDKAFAEVSSLANAKIENKDFDAAEEILKSFLSEAARSVDGRRALSALYKTVGKTAEAATVLVQAAEILIEDGNDDEAKEVLSKVLELDPDQGDATRLLESLQPPPPPLDEPEPFIEQPAPAVKAAPAPPAASIPEPVAAPALPQETPAVIEALTEIDVLVKYGLATKGLEQLEALAKKFPESVQVRIKLRDLYGDLGNMSKAADHMLILADLYDRQGKQDLAEQVVQAAFEMDPGNVQIRTKLGMPITAPVAADSADLLFEEAPGMISAIPDEIPMEQPADIMTGFDMAEPAEELFFPGQAAEQDAPPAGSEELPFDQPFAVPDFASEPQRSFAGEERLAEPEAFPETPASIFGEQEAEATEPFVQEMDISEVWAEAEFYYQQGLFEEARKHYQKIIEVAPENLQARDRMEEILKEQEEAQEFSKLADAVDGLEGLDGFTMAASVPEMASSESDEEAVRSLMQEIAQLKQKAAPPLKEKAPAPLKAPTPPRPGPMKTFPEKTQSKPSPVRQEEDFFDLGVELNGVDNLGSPSQAQALSQGSSEDFFDLASELRDELSSVTMPSAPSESTEDQSLDDIFEEFKKGVEQQAIKEDADTHYNLGIAYKEMGLLDDAISEFIMTHEDEPKFVQSRYMLGLCYLEKGDYPNAIAEIQQALSSAQAQGSPTRDCMSMQYDLGLAFQGAGKTDNALREFQKVYTSDRGYRDAGDKIKELEQGGSFSLEQLKNDIEKEISSKFLEEGERIEREEKTKKNERVRI